jgi:hypothetical protein
VQQPDGPGKFEIPTWDQSSLAAARSELKKEAVGLSDFGEAFGLPGEVDPRQHLVATAAGWGGNPARDAIYVGVEPKENDGKRVHRLRVKDVPVDGFWSITVYDKAGLMIPNAQAAYSLNNITAKRDVDGAYTIQFGGCGDGAGNCLPVVPGWNYLVRLYRPQPQILNGSWKFPEARPVS